MRKMIQILAVLGVMWLSLWLLVSLVGDAMLFPAPPPSYRLGPGMGVLKSSAGDRIAFLRMRDARSTHALIVSHGNGEDLGMLSGYLRGFVALGYDVISYDYPGYGLSSGKPSEAGSYAAVESVYSYVTNDLGYPPERVFALGRSLGGGPALKLATSHPLAGLILESSFLSAQRVYMPIRVIPWDRFDNASMIRKSTVPLLVVHGTQDQVVPFSHGKRLWELANDPKLFFWVEGAGHNDVASNGSTAYLETVDEFRKWVDRSVRDSRRTGDSRDDGSRP